MGRCRKALVLILALGGAGAAYAVGWLEWHSGEHAALQSFEAFYWKLQKGDLPAARALALPGSEAERVLAALDDATGSGAADPSGAVARGFALDVSQRADGKHEGRPAVRIAGRATITIVPAGRTSAFGVLVPHEVEARLVQDGDAWRVSSFRDAVASEPPDSEGRQR